MIRDIPQEFSEFIFLKNMILSNNDIEEIPESFTKLTTLDALYLDGNIISSTNLPLKVKALRFGEFEEPNEILPRLFLGPAHVARNKHLLKRKKISHVLTVADIEPPHSEVKPHSF